MIRIQLHPDKKMQFSSVQSNNLSQRFRSIQKVFRTQNLTKKTAFVGISICIFILYFAPYLFQRISLSFQLKPVFEDCITRHIEQYKNAVNEVDAFISVPQLDGKNKLPLPFVGNGKLGTLVQDNAMLYLFYEVQAKSNLDLKLKPKIRTEEHLYKLPFNPLLTVERVTGVDRHADATVVNFREGIVERLTCYRSDEYSEECIFLNHTVVAHRSRPNVLLQHLSVNPDKAKSLRSSMDIHLKKEDLSLNNNFKPVPVSVTSGIPFSLYSGVVSIPSGGSMAIVYASKTTSNKISLSSGQDHVDAVTVVMHSEVFKDASLAEKAMQKLINDVKLHIEEVILIRSDELLREHKAAWKDILHTGLTVSTAKQPGIPDSRVINSTLYYVLSSSDSKLHDKDIPEKERKDLIKRLQTPDFCYQEHPTFHGEKLWRQVNSVDEIAQLQRLWSLTLRKNRCESLVSEGAEGILQAMLLSFGGLKFTESDLRLETDPEVLHNDIAFHRLVYQNNTLDIAIRRDYYENPEIVITLHRTPKVPLYACEAGCERQEVELSTTPQAIPVYITDPPTPILYISHDRKHLLELKSTLHVKRRLEHSAHMEATRKGTGLPWIFWLGIGSLIILFHLFLIRLIIKEYYSNFTDKHRTRLAS